MASAQAMRRIAKEMADIRNLNSPSFTAGPKSDSDLLNWQVEIFGPKDTPYESGRFKLDLVLPPAYPFSPPTLTFITKIYHPNILHDGTVCIAQLKTDQWKPACKLVTIIECAISLLSQPNMDDAVEGDVADVWNNDRSKFERTAREWTKKYAK
ncbi:ubiquitin-conjugating enzyme/RWD-like protein [Kockiozyma suomiensis]|uniref:ubiquitin-conjugating enzyme/RWD-like protein n=1 Tax=Kockiozyma suomiensis TaxID=1337062 RepID=UPI0033437073